MSDHCPRDRTHTFTIDVTYRQYAHHAAELGKRDREIDTFVLTSLFSTLTNVNFDPERFRTLLQESTTMLARARAVQSA